ncbi:MAG: alanine--tRNA ligase [Oscillospiraceae bacterium]|nr:alanine--tRNA ligase [Oscillospiraceae bacterium]
MKWMGLNELRERFLTFFEGKGHLRQPSYPLVPLGDASLLLINSGMAPLKNYFMGIETPPRARMTTCQKCIRTPDIERVGKTSRHGTYFEMLGNFSFGDYFKSEATAWAWEFITKEMNMPVDRLWISIYLDDDQAFDIWTKEIGVSPDRIVRMGKEDNFWEIGTGPCGPCSEIYFDRGREKGCDRPDCAVGCDCDRFVEFWNLVFTQFDSDGNGHYTPLAKPNIDTGMGLERLACIMQGVDNLFETDTIQNIMTEIADMAGVRYGESEKTDVALRVITDHIRSTVFLVGDGVVPQNEGRGYVLRRLLRRAARFGRLLGINGPFLYKVAERVMKENESAYPALLENAGYIQKVIQIEEERFLKTIVQGMDILAEMIEKAGKGGRLPGEAIFKLYDTFGFPLDLTREIAEERGVEIDEAGFQAQMKEQRERARKARLEQGGVGWEEDVLAGEDFEQTFVGYELLSIGTQLMRIVKGGQLVDGLAEGDEAALLLEATPFYAESGGQVGDTGFVKSQNGAFRVLDTKKSPTGHTMLIGKVSSGVFKKGDTVTGEVDKHRRKAIMRNHTAAHLLQAALREVLGDHVHQAGQMVDEHVCRFDFSHFAGMTGEELRVVEEKVNRLALSALPVGVSEMNMEQAKAEGALALFGDKYSEIVRVVNISGKSVELCGGSHIGNTAELGLFKILHESSVAAGVRRIEAVTGRGVLRYFEEREALLQKSCEALKLAAPAELPAKVEALSAQVKSLQKKSDELAQKMAMSQADALTAKMKQVGPVRVLATTMALDGVPALKATADSLKEKHPDIVGVIAMDDGGKSDKVSLIAFAGKDALAAGVHAGKLIQSVAGQAGGSGGGRPDNAMGGAPANKEKIRTALSLVDKFVETQVGVTG